MRYVLVLTMPSNNVYVVSTKDKDLILIPVERGKENVLKGVMSFDSFEDAEKWRTETAKLNEQGAKLMDMTKPMPVSELN